MTGQVKKSFNAAAERAVVFELARSEEVRRSRFAIRAEHDLHCAMAVRACGVRYNFDLALVAHDGLLLVRGVQIMVAHAARNGEAE